MDMSEIKDKTSLQNLAGGGVNELFESELERVVKNIQDPNTEATQKREIVIKVSITPDETREVGKVQAKVESKIAGAKPIATLFYMGTYNGKGIALENNPRQTKFNFTPEIRPVQGESE